MTKLSAAVLSMLALMLMSVAPASAATTLNPCTGGGVGFGTHDTAVTPDYTPVLGEVAYQFRVDLSGQEVAEGAEPLTTADVNVVLSWSGFPASDYDMTVNGEDVWNNPIPPGTSEELLLSNVKHCAFIDVTVWTYVGTPIDAVTLTLDVAP